LSPAFVAVTLQVPAAFVTLKVVRVTAHPVEDPALKVTAPVPEPPELERVEVAP
jgi:hypothetical protein